MNLHEKELRAEERLRQAGCKGRDIYQEYIISVIVKHKDTEFGHSHWTSVIGDSVKRSVRNNNSVKAVQILKGLKRTPEMAALEGDWLEM